MRTAAVARIRRVRMVYAVVVMAVIVFAAALYSMKSGDRDLAAPMSAILGITITFILILWARDGAPPVFEAGTLCVLANALYGCLPLTGFLMMHGQWDINVDTRLNAYPFLSSELGVFGWRYAVYAGSFAATYLVVRGRATVKATSFRLPKPDVQAATVVVFVVLYAIKLALRIAYDYDPEALSYTGDMALESAALNAKPYLVLQIGHNVLGSFLLVQQAVLILLFARWRQSWARYTLGIWLAGEVAATVIRLGSRSVAVILLISAGVLYHRLVKRVTFRTAIAAGTLLLAGFLIVGAIRVRQPGVAESGSNILTAANEFQGLFTTAFDIHKKREAGLIAAVPWQIYVSDLYLLIPSQILPFEKVDPAAWYIELIGQTGAGAGYMFGVMSQAAVGLDWIELVLRGAALGVSLALLQRWYVRHSMEFWPTLFCLFASVWTYMTFRASTFYFVYFIVYHFLPVVMVTKMLAPLVHRIRGKSVAPRALQA